MEDGERHNLTFFGVSFELSVYALCKRLMARYWRLKSMLCRG